MKIAFNPSTVAALTTPPNNKDITFDLRGRNIFARGVKFQGTDTWRDIKINNVSIGSNILDLRNGSNTTLTNTNGVVTINSIWRPVVDDLTSDSTTSSLSANQGRVLAGLINGKSDSGHNHDGRYLKLTGGTMLLGGGLKFHSNNNYFGTNADARIISLLDNNDKICDGGLIIDERATLDGKEYVTELLRIRDSEFKWRGADILHSSNYSGILDSRYYTESEVNSLLSRKLDRVNLTTGSWNPRGYSLAADYYYNGGDLSISENGGKMYVSINGQFYQNEGQYRVLDTSDISSIRGSLTLYQYLSSTDNNWFPLIWGGSDHKNTNNSTGSLYKSYDKLSWQTSSQTLYATNIQTENIKRLSIGGGIYWNPYVESATAGDDPASITVVESGIAGGTTLVLSQMNDDNDTIQFKTNTAARLYHNSYPILTTQNTYVSNNKGYINGAEITQVNNSDTVDGYHATDGRTFTGNINWSDYWDDTWSDGTNEHPWYGFDHRYPNTGAYSTTISDYFGMTIKTAGPLRLDFRTLFLNGTSIYSINVASATKLQTARKIWGQSFDGTADISGTLSGVAHIQFSADNTYNIGSNNAASRYIYAYWLGAKSGQKLELGANNSNFGQGLCIDTNLNVGIGTSTPAYKLDIRGDIRATGNSYATHFYESSDKTLKKNIKSILSSTNIPKIREFDWKDTGEHSYGFIAQELEEQGYDCLVNEADGKKTVNYTATLALTVAKLQNLINIQNKKISNLTKELKALKYGRKKNS